MFGFELVKDRAAKEVFPASEHISYAFEKIALQNGLVVYPCSGSLDGVMGDMVLLAPPLVMTAPEVEETLNILDLSLGELEDRYLI